MFKKTLCFKKDFFAIFILILIFIFIAIVRLNFFELEHGDEYSDANALSAGKNFYRFGFIKCYFLPLFNPQPQELKDFYTHYPPLSDILNGLLRTVFKKDSLFIFRGFSIFLSFFTIFFWYIFIRKIFKNTFLAFLSTLFYLTNSVFIFCIDGLHQHCYGDFLRNFSFLIFLYYLEKRKNFYFSLLWLLYFFLSLTTYEYIIYLFFFFILFNLFFKYKNKFYLGFKKIVFLALAPTVGFFLHFIQNIWYFKSVKEAFFDIYKVAGERIVYSKDTALTLNIVNWFKFVFLRNISLVFGFEFIFVLSFFIFSFIIFLNLKRNIKEELKPIYFIGVIFFICGITWYIFFPAHTLAHTFLTFLARHLLPFSSILLACFFMIIFSFIKNFNPKNFFGRVSVLVLLVFISLKGILQSELPLTSERKDFYKEFLIFKNCLLNLKNSSKTTAQIGTNYFRFPFIRYYTDRNCIFFSNKKELEKLFPLPDYFIFFFYENPISKELFEFLNSKYIVLEKCNSHRFPALIFKLKEDGG